ncbi:3'-to-5' oligoribonuclease [Cutibacterium acnes JCM 18920]|nr:3'-to-5' oligoribonuclease [Cutibacterium acnes JCM 18920]
MLVWIDCEMTGLDLAHDGLIEVAALVTDGQLNVQGEGVDVIIKPESQWLDHMNDFVRDMHTTSGLLAELDKGLTMTQAQDQVLDYIRTYVPQAGKAPLAGNTIGTDRSFLVKDMPKLESYVHYRNVDVSSIKELARRWYRAHSGTPRRSRATTERSLTSRNPLRSSCTGARSSWFPPLGRRPHVVMRSPPSIRASSPGPGETDAGGRESQSCISVSETDTLHGLPERGTWWL